MCVHAHDSALVKVRGQPTGLSSFTPSNSPIALRTPVSGGQAHSLSDFFISRALPSPERPRNSC